MKKLINIIVVMLVLYTGITFAQQPKGKAQNIPNDIKIVYQLSKLDNIIGNKFVFENVLYNPDSHFVEPGYDFRLNLKDGKYSFDNEDFIELRTLSAYGGGDFGELEKFQVLIYSKEGVEFLIYFRVKDSEFELPERLSKNNIAINYNLPIKNLTFSVVDVKVNEENDESVLKQSTLFDDMGGCIVFYVDVYKNPKTIITGAKKVYKYNCSKCGLESSSANKKDTLCVLCESLNKK